MRTDIARLRDQVSSLSTANEETTRRITGADAEKLHLEQESAEKDRLLLERDEQIQELEQTIKQAQESGTKLRKALHKMKETITTNEQTHVQELGQ
jgi:chromosome segregation ATPase